MANRSRSLLLLIACAPYLPVAHSTERVGEATYLYEVERYAIAVTDLEGELLSLIDTASGEDRFILYWTYNLLTGAWLQVEYLHAQLQLAVAARSDREHEAIRTTLRDQAQFVLLELDNAADDLEQNFPERKRPDHLWINESLRSLLAQVRMSVDRLLADQCSRMLCAAVP